MSTSARATSPASSGVAGSPRAATVALVLAAIGLVVAGGYGALRWSLLPDAVDGTVVSTEYQSETGLHYRVLVVDDGTNQVVAKQVVDRLGGEHDLVGRHLRTRRWDPTVWVDGRAVRVPIGWASVRALFALVVLAGLGVWSRWWRLGPSWWTTRPGASGRPDR